MKAFTRKPQLTIFIAHSVLVWLATASSVLAQNSVRVIVPQTVVEHGEELRVTVEVTSQVPVAQILGVGGSLGPATELSAERSGNVEVREYAIQIQPRVLIGGAYFIVRAVLEDGTRVDSDRQKVQVEPARAFVELRVRGPRVPLRYAGDSAELNVIGIGANGKQQSLNDSSRVAISSENSAVVNVTVQPLLVRAVGPGSATVRVRYLDSSRGVDIEELFPISVDDGMQGDFDGDGRITVDDYNELYSLLERARGARHLTSRDARDLDGNGVIDGADLSLLVSLCKFPNCDIIPPREGEATPTPLPTLTWMVTRTPTPAGTSIPTHTPISTPAAAETPTSVVTTTSTPPTRAVISD